MTADKAKELGLKPLAKYKVSATAGLEPAVMGLGPIYATRKAIQRSGVSIDQLGLVELNEAFASQSLECMNQNV